VSTATGLSLLMIANQRRVLEMERAWRAAMFPLEAHAYWVFGLYMSGLDTQRRLTYTPTKK
jgi:hypothetical protein